MDSEPRPVVARLTQPQPTTRGAPVAAGRCRGRGPLMAVTLMLAGPGPEPEPGRRGRLVLAPAAPGGPHRAIQVLRLESSGYESDGPAPGRARANHLELDWSCQCHGTQSDPVAQGRPPQRGQTGP